MVLSSGTSFEGGVIMKLTRKTMGASILAAVGLVITGIASAAITSTFDADSDGWSAIGDFAAPVQWVAAGGNPGGHIEIPDAVLGGVTFFVAPAKFLGDKSVAIGSALTFDLQQLISGGANQFDDSDVTLSGNGITLVYNLPSNPAIGSWTSYSVPLTASGWTVNTLGGAAASDAQFQQVLAALTQLRIRAEYQTGPDTGLLDNVSLVPEPTSVAMLLLGLLILMSVVRGRARLFLSAARGVSRN
jgi:Laminin B (Domain IV)